MRRFGLFSLALPFFDTEGGAGSGAPPSTPAAPAAASPGGNPSAPAAGAPVSGAPPAAPAGPKHYTYTEDRSNWVPSHVVRQRTEEAQRLQQELALWKSRTEALSGVKAPTAPNPEADAIKAQFFQVFPEAQKVFGIVDKLEKLAGVNIDEIVQSQQQSWVQHGARVLDSVVEKIRAVYGGQELAPKATERIQRAFVSELESDPDLRARYDRGDLSVIDDFVKDYTGTILDPYRRSTQAAAPAAPGSFQRRLPRGGGGSAVVPGARPATLKPSDGDDFHKAAFASFSRG